MDLYFKLLMGWQIYLNKLLVSSDSFFGDVNEEIESGLGANDQSSFNRKLRDELVAKSQNSFNTTKQIQRLQIVDLSRIRTSEHNPAESLFETFNLCHVLPFPDQHFICILSKKSFLSVKILSDKPTLVYDEIR